jgi:glycerol-3-phosphate acyltransferase PlsY
MITIIYFLLFLVFSYVLGCISTGYYLVKFSKSEDIRNSGSKGTGATNVGRILGKKGFIIVLIIDILKGMLIAFLCRYYNFTEAQCVLSIMALASGHIWPAQLKFKGGKGIAVLMGFFFIWQFYMLLTFGIVMGISYLTLKSFKKGGLISFMVFPIYGICAHFEPIVILLLVFLSGIIYFAHRENIKEFIKPIFYKK